MVKSDQGTPLGGFREPVRKSRWALCGPPHSLYVSACSAPFYTPPHTPAPQERWDQKTWSLFALVQTGGRLRALEVRLATLLCFLGSWGGLHYVGSGF